MASMWVSWEKHRRSRELARYLGVELVEFDSKLPRIVKHPMLSLKTIFLYVTVRPKVVIVQNPSIILSLISCCMKSVLKFTLVVDLHNAAIQPENAVQKWFYFFYKVVHRKADLCIVTNGALKEYIARFSSDAKVTILPDKLPTVDSEFDRRSVTEEQYFVLICTFGIDEPYSEVIEAARLLDGAITLYITGNHDRCPHYIKQNLPANVHFTGYLRNGDYLSLLHFSDGIIDLTERKNCLVCGAYEGVALGKPLILSNTEALVSYFYKGSIFCQNNRLSIKEAMLRLKKEKLHYELQVRALKEEINAAWPGHAQELQNFLARVENM